MTAAPPTSDLNALQGEKGLVVDIANGQSIAGGCGRALRDAGSHVLG
jgi:enoyl-[acyl-carrier-protein] reductase (NADH)